MAQRVRAAEPTQWGVAVVVSGAVEAEEVAERVSDESYRPLCALLGEVSLQEVNRST